MLGFLWKRKMNQTQELFETGDVELEAELISLFETTSRLEYELELVVQLHRD